jgi:hypothetical protein
LVFLREGFYAVFGDDYFVASEESVGGCVPHAQCVPTINVFVFGKEI